MHFGDEIDFEVCPFHAHGYYSSPTMSSVTVYTSALLLMGV